MICPTWRKASWLVSRLGTVAICVPDLVKSNAVKRTFVLCLTTALLVSTAHRSPAPISEESPTPRPEQSAKPKAKHSATPKPTVAKSSPSPSQPTPQQGGIYTGTWIGPDHVIVINAAQDTVNISGCPSGNIFSASVGADNISWRTGNFREHKWTLKPYPDGKTALVTYVGTPIIFKRVN